MPYSTIWKQLLVCCAIAVTTCASAQTGHTIVTVEQKAGNSDAVLRENILAFEAGKRVPITVWQPFTGDRDSLQLLILIDDSSASGLANQLADIRTFVMALPKTAEVGIGYMQNGRAEMAQNFTADHALAARALRLPQSIRGGGSPYFTLSAVAQQWPAAQQRPSEKTAGRREILMISDGVDRYSDLEFNPENPYVTKAIHDAQRAAIPVFTIYYRGAGRLDANPVVTSAGQNYLVQMSQETGGKSLYPGMGNPVSLTPMLTELSKILNNQYELEFKSRAKPMNGLVQLKLKMETHGIKLIAPTFVPVDEPANPERLPR
ncbi:MAG TPA: hypothetical protein VM554_06205 [Acidisarcina sp.]|nr:hypothetical protein [Acidisarcina sp.]